MSQALGILRAMERQLALLEVPTVWRLDDETRVVGRDGVAQARAALREARQAALAEHPTAA
jgi:hypothetical protein